MGSFAKMFFLLVALSMPLNLLALPTNFFAETFQPDYLLSTENSSPEPTTERLLEVASTSEPSMSTEDDLTTTFGHKLAYPHFDLVLFEPELDLLDSGSRPKRQDPPADPAASAKPEVKKEDKNSEEGGSSSLFLIIGGVAGLVTAGGGGFYAYRKLVLKKDDN